MSSRLNDSIRTLFKSGGVLLVGLVLELGLSFVAKIVIARVLTRADYGGIALASTLATTLALAAGLGMEPGIGRYLPRSDDAAAKRSVLVTAFGLAVPLSLVFGALTYVSAPTVAGAVFHAPEVTPIIRVFAFVVPLSVCYSLVTGAIQGSKESLPKVVIENVSRPVARFVAVLIVALVGVSATRMALAYLVGWLVPVGIGVGYLYTRTPIFDRSVDYAFKARELLSFSIPLVLSGAMILVFNDLDTLMLGYFTDTSGVGIYNVVYPLSKLLTTGLTAFGFVFLPIISDLHADGATDDLQRVYQVVMKWVFMITLPVFLVMALFPAMTITLTFGAKYRPGATTLSVLAIGFFASSMTGLNSKTLMSIGYTRLIFYVNAGAALLNTVLNLLLIPPMGYLGAGIATAATFVALNATFTYLVYREFEVVPLTRSVVRPAVFAVALVVAFTLLVRHYFSVTVPELVALFICFLLTYALLLVRFGAVEEEEIMLVHSIEERFSVNFGPLKRVWRIVRSE